MCLQWLLNYDEVWGSLTADSLRDREYSILQLFFSYDEFWVRTLQTLFGGWNMLFYNDF